MRAGSGAAGSVPLQKVVGAVNLAQSIRRYGHLAAQLDPLGAQAARRSVAPARDPRPDRRRPAARCRRRWSRRALVRPGPTMLDAIDALAPRLLLDHRLRLRARVRARGARLAAAGGRGRPLPRAGGSDRSGRAARSADPGRGVRALPAPHVPGQDAVLDRRARHARADPRRGDRRSRPRRASATS